jgi:hypothetical protein
MKIPSTSIGDRTNKPWDLLAIPRAGLDAYAVTDQVDPANRSRQARFSALTFVQHGMRWLAPTPANSRR